MRDDYSRPGRAVLYTDDFEPITVLELSRYMWSLLEETGYARLRVRMAAELKYLMANPNHSVVEMRDKDITIKGELLRRRGVTTMMLFTQDDETALLLKSAFLPGQLSEVQRRERRKFGEGFIAALNATGGL